MALVGVALLWGSSVPATKALLPFLPPTVLALLRVLVAVGVLVPGLRRRGARPSWGRAPALLGLTGVAGAIVFQNLGLLSASAANATLILGAGIPVLTLLCASRLLAERVGARGMAGFAASVAGVVVLVGFGEGGENLVASLVGGALLLASAASAVHAVVGRRAFVGRNPLPLVTGGFVYGALFLVPVATAEALAVGWSRPTLPALGLLLVLGVG